MNILRMVIANDIQADEVMLATTWCRYDATKEVPGWADPTFTAQGWHPVVPSQEYSRSHNINHAPLLSNPENNRVNPIHL